LNIPRLIFDSQVLLLTAFGPSFRMSIEIEILFRIFYARAHHMGVERVSALIQVKMASSRVTPSQILDDFLEEDDDVINGNNSDVGRNSSSLNFDKSDVVPFAEVLNWWRMNSDRYLILVFMARKYLAVRATSAASESVFRY